MLEKPSTVDADEHAPSRQVHAQEIEQLQDAVAGQLNRMVAELVLVRPPGGAPPDVQRLVVTARQVLAAVREHDRAP